ncbi:MAG: hypothetical protein SH857_06695 [Chitinophagales bacterium]|nr:hypothetical protein [Chitinophagales bacterium]
MTALKSLAILLLLFSACSQPEEYYQKIYGKWKAADWLVNGQSAGKNITNVSFQFNADKTYQSKLGAKGENGIFKLKSEYLYTTAEGQLEIMVKIAKLTADSLVLDMNNAGQSETLLLVKE